MKKLFLLVALLAAAPAVFAQDYYGLPDYGLRKNTTRVDFYGGLALPQQNWKVDGIKAANTTWTAGIGFQRNVLNFLSFGLDGNYVQFDGDKDAANHFLRTGIATGLVSGRVYLFPSQATRLYATGGLGIGYTFARKNVGDERVTKNSTDLAGMVGVGLEFDIDDEWMFGAEARYNLVKMEDEVKEFVGKNKVHFTTIMLKFGYRF